MGVMLESLMAILCLIWKVFEYENSVFWPQFQILILMAKNLVLVLCYQMGAQIIKEENLKGRTYRRS